MVRRSTLAVSLVVVMVLVSGCSAVLDGGNGNGAGTGNGDGAGNGDASTFEYPDGFGPEGVTDGDAAVESHQSGIVDRGSYTGSYVYTINTSEGTTVIDVQNRVDFEGEKGLQRAGVTYPGQEGDITIYRDSDTRYRRSQFNNQTSIQSQNQSFDARNLTATDPIRPLLVNVSAYDSSVEQQDGDSVVVYETSEATGVDSFVGINQSANITSFTATMTVDADGVVRSASYDVSYTIDGQQRDLTVEYELSGFGETTVERPAWVDDA